MNILNSKIILGIILIVLSAVFYLLHYFIFRDAHHIVIYLIGDIAFVFIEVLMVTMIIHQLLEARDKKSRLEKLNMVIGAFFSEVGTKLIAYLSDFDPMLDKIRKDLLVTNNWTDRQFAEVSKRFRNYDYSVEIEKVNLEHLHDFLSGKRNFLLRVLENPTLLEHESFTDLLQAVFHLTEELLCRHKFEELPENDYKHLSGDIKRVYLFLVGEWLNYMKHLKKHYPYLFSLAIRTNPFDQSASPIIG